MFAVTLKVWSPTLVEWVTIWKPRHSSGGMFVFATNDLPKRPDGQAPKLKIVDDLTTGPG